MVDPRLEFQQYIQLVPGYYIFFIASLADHSIVKPSFLGYFIIGYFELEKQALAIDIVQDAMLSKMFEGNAHLRPGYFEWDYAEKYQSIIFKGTSNSCLLQKAVPFSKHTRLNRLARLTIPNPRGFRWWSTKEPLQEKRVKLLLDEVSSIQD